MQGVKSLSLNHCKGGQGGWPWSRRYACDAGSGAIDEDVRGDGFGEDNRTGS